jgi:AraC family ethanolamine operon transcriptional activator
MPTTAGMDCDEQRATCRSHMTGDLDMLARWRCGFTYSLLGRGPVQAQVSAVDFNDVALRLQSTDRSVSCRGQVGKGLGCLELWPQQSRKIAVNGRLRSPGQIFLSVGSDAVDVTSVGPSDSVILTFKLARFRNTLSTEAADLLSGDPANRGLIDLAGERGQACAAAHSIMRAAAAQTDPDNSDRAESFIRTLVEGSARMKHDVPAAIVSASRIVLRAVEVMLSNVSEPLGLTDIAAACNVSQRTLIYQFNDVVGITPMAYYKLQRLNAVRRALKAADIRITRVIDVAAGFGFYHMGHFAADFRELFGRLPSEMLGIERTFCWVPTVRGEA